MARAKKRARIDKEEEEIFLVEYFKQVKVDEDGEWIYLVKWAGYDNPNDDTWEPASSVANCQRLLSSFWYEIGTDNGDYHPGDSFTPSQEWIRKEIAHFAKTHKDDAKNKREKRIAAQKAREAEQESRKRSYAGRSTKTTRSVPVVRKKSRESSTKTQKEEDDDSSDDDGVFPKIVAGTKGKKPQLANDGRKNVKKEKGKDVTDDSDDDGVFPKVVTGTKGKKPQLTNDEKKNVRKEKGKERVHITDSSSGDDSDRPLLERKRKRVNLSKPVATTKVDGKKKEDALFLPEEAESSVSFLILFVFHDLDLMRRLSRQTPQYHYFLICLARRKIILWHTCSLPIQRTQFQQKHNQLSKLHN
ncbi:hypothetical protein BDP27DRAFT_583829 [Rhodocollybia butyracea]|uniref:Chromo domain-containing protein n=1 Tax=Rhodocollybia butyracea TaxID=206335 RepID=A0A9P5UA63_9AGAR|nr:hypothetical protein BDP27DRAFT_583829 [Rhodocollybia butyracea]